MSQIIIILYRTQIIYHDLRMRIMMIMMMMVVNVIPHLPSSQPVRQLQLYVMMERGSFPETTPGFLVIPIPVPVIGPKSVPDSIQVPAG